jgi:hypothetical protein
MASLTNFAENKLIDALFRGQALGNPATWYFKLYTVAPDETGAGTEVTGGSYARASVACSLANFAGTQGAGTTVASNGTSGTTSNNIAIAFPAPTANWGVIVGMSLCDASTGGNDWIYAPLTTPKTVNANDAAPTFTIGSFTHQVDN